MSLSTDSARGSSRRRGLAVNTVAQAAPMLVGYVASFASAPLVLASLGLKAFGVWALTGALASYASLLDFGVGPVLVRFVALYAVEEKEERIPAVLGTGCITSALITVVLAGASVPLAGPLAASMHVGIAEMHVLLICATILFSASLFTNVLTAYAVGMQEMVGPNVAMTAGAVLNFVLSVAAALSSHSLVRYAEANALASILTVAIVVVFAVRSMRGRTSIRIPNRATVREVLGFSFNAQALNAANLIADQTDKIIIAFAVGPAAAGAYELANRVAAAGRAIGIMAVGAMMPTMTEVGIGGSEQELRRTYLRWTSITSTLGIPVLLLLACLPIVILHAWLGQTPPDSALVLSGLSIGYVLLGTTAVGYILSAAKGRPDLPAKVWCGTAVGNLAITLCLAPFFGVVGVLIGTAVAFTVGSLCQVWLVHRAFSIPFSDYIHAVRPCLALGIVTAAPLLAVNFAAAHADRSVQAAVAITCGAVFCLVYAVGANRLGLLPPVLSRRLPLAPRGVLGPVVQG